MTLYGVIAAAIVRKVKALIAEYRSLVAEATVKEKAIVTTAENDIEDLYTVVKAEERAIVAKTKAATEFLRDELIDKIAKV